MTEKPGPDLGRVGFEVWCALIESGDLDSDSAEFGRFPEPLPRFNIAECLGTRGGSGPESMRGPLAGGRHPSTWRGCISIGNSAATPRRRPALDREDPLTVLLVPRFAGVPVIVCLQLATGHSEAGADHQDPDNRSQSTRYFHTIPGG
jgi:hypothetical protein